MRQEEINMNSLQYELPRIKTLLRNGKKIVIKDLNEPIAIIYPVNKEKLVRKNVKDGQKTLNSFQSSYESTASEMWFG